MKILATARDIGAGRSLVAILAYLQQHYTQVETVIYAQEPAYSMLIKQQCDIDVKLVRGIKLNIVGDSNPIISIAESVFQNTNPDLVLTCLSTPFDIGIDEAMVFVAKGRVKTILLQDFWGEINTLLGVKPDICLVLDDDARFKTVEKHAVESIVIGPVQYAKYKEKDFMQQQQLIWSKYGLNAKQKIAGWFGQPLHCFEGYKISLFKYIQLLLQIDSSIKIIYRPHPRETRLEINETLSIFEGFGVVPLVLQIENIEESIVACNVMASIYSICSFDACYINYYAKQTTTVPITWLITEDLRKHCERLGGLQHHNFLNSGMVLNVFEENEAFNILKISFDDTVKEDVNNACKQLMDPEKSLEYACDIITRNAENLSQDGVIGRP